MPINKIPIKKILIFAELLKLLKGYQEKYLRYVDTPKIINDVKGLGSGSEGQRSSES